DLSRIDLKIDVPESIMVNVRGNEKPAKITAFFDAIPDTAFPLEFKDVATQPDEVTKTYQVTLSMKSKPQHNILPGMTARVVAERKVSEDLSSGIYLPANVVLKDSRGNFVYIVKSHEDGTGIVVKKPVDIGDISQLGIEILSGIDEGEAVLTAGMSKVSDGMKVKF
ncbi:MAG: efflux RND transporter periplasmic adaptor subunit, partial [Pseudomonadota bacterium]